MREIENLVSRVIEKKDFNFAHAFVGTGMKNVIEFAETVTHGFSAFKALVSVTIFGVASLFHILNKVIKEFHAFLKCIFPDFL